MKAKIFSTRNFQTIQELCNQCAINSRMIGLIGYPGAGKTIGLQYYKRNRIDVIYTTVRKTMSSKNFYLEVLNALGFEGEAVNVSLHQIMNMIVRKINAHPTKILLIIDEAGKFKPGQLEYIHELRDQTSHKMGIILAGPEYFYDNIYEWKEKKVIGIPEVFRRIHTFHTLEYPQKDEIKQIANEYGIEDKNLIKNLYNRVGSFDELTKEIEKIIQDN